MSEAEEGSYEHACMRAELLGLPLPDRETFEIQANLGRRSANDDEDEYEAEREFVEEDEKQTKIAEELGNQKDDLKNVTGGLEELTNILSLTQVKINKFKTVCGSIKNLFKLRDNTQLDGKEGEAGGSQCATDTEDNENNEERQAAAAAATANQPQAGGAVGGNPKQVGQQINSQLTSQMDKLDALISKAENAELSMQSQNKQMRNFLR